MAAKKKSGTKKNFSGSEQVTKFMHNLEHPLKEEIEHVRRIILSTNGKLTEHIKWNAPSFRYEDEDRITFNLHGKGLFRLIFHCGAKVKDREHMANGPVIDDTSGILEWKSDDRAIMTFTDKNDIIAKEDRLREVIRKWLEVV